MRQLSLLGVTFLGAIYSFSAAAVTAGYANVTAATSNGCRGNAQGGNVIVGGSNYSSGTTFVGFSIDAFVLDNGVERMVMRLNSDHTANVYEGGLVFGNDTFASGTTGTWSGYINVVNNNQGWNWNVAVVANGCTFYMSGQSNNIGF